MSSAHHTSKLAEILYFEVVHLCQPVVTYSYSAEAVDQPLYSDVQPHSSRSAPSAGSSVTND